MPRKKLPYTKKELAELDRLSWLVSSQRQMERIDGRFRMRDFVAKHGKEKCDLMWDEIKRRDNGG
jgi:hypothetical protein